MLDALSPARRRFVLGLVVLALVAVARRRASRCGRRGTRPSGRCPRRRRDRCCSCPGTAAGPPRSRCWPTHSGRRAARRSVVDLPGDNSGDLDEQARALDKAVVLQMQREGARSVDVVGYSAGGVVARLWVREHGGDSLARRIVTIGSPHHGTDLAGLGADVAPDSCPEACQQLLPDSELLRKLNAGDETPAGPAVGLDLDHRRPDRGAAVVGRPRRRPGLHHPVGLPACGRQPRRPPAHAGHRGRDRAGRRGPAVPGPRSADRRWLRCEERQRRARGRQVRGSAGGLTPQPRGASS